MFLTRVPSLRPVIPVLLATTDPSDSPPQHPAWLLIPKPSLPGHKAPTAAAGLPSSRRFCRRALSPFTPGNPVRASDRATAQVQASPPLAGWPFPLMCNEAESSSLNATARAFTFPGFTRWRCAHLARGRLHDFRSFIMVSTFHLTRTAKLSWRTRDTKHRGRGGDLPRAYRPTHIQVAAHDFCFLRS